MHFSLASTWYAIGGLATAIVIVLAFLSWHLMEKRALSLKDRMLPVEDRLSAQLDSAALALRSIVLRLSQIGGA